MKMKILLTLIAAAMTISTAQLKANAAEDIPVKLKPKIKMTTSDILLKEGDPAEFLVAEDVLYNGAVIIPKNTLVTGMIASLEPNNWLMESAKVIIDDLYAVGENGQKIPLSGSVFKAGNKHETLGGFLSSIIAIELLPVFIRGGEVQIEPKKDTFTVFLRK